MSSHYEWWVHSIEDDPVDGPYKSMQDALEAADDDQAVIEYEFEYADSYLVDPRFDEWPPPVEEEE